MKWLSRALALGCLVTTTTAARPLRGPYIQLTTPSSATVVWRTDGASTSTLRYGSAPDALDSTLTDSSTATQHEVEITGLQPDTKYYYAVGPAEASLAGGDEDHFFVTAPEAGSAKPFTFWVVGDSGVATAKQARVRDAMLRESGQSPPDVYLHVGDMAYSDGTDQEFQDRFFAMYQNILRNTPTYPAIGNHEGGASDSLTATGPYYDAYVLPTQAQVGGVASGTEAYYSWDWSNVHFIALESYRAELRATDGAMLAWLEMDLASTDADWLVVYFHHPPYTKGSHDSDTEIGHIEMRERVMPMLEAAGVDLVLGGHSHIYERSYLIKGAYDTPTTAEGHIVDSGDGEENRPYVKTNPDDGNVCIVAGHGGTNVGRDGDEEHVLMHMTELVNGSVIVSVDGDLMRVKNVRMDGVVSDAFSITRGETLALTGPTAADELVAGSTVAVTWVSAGIDDVTIEYRSEDSWERVTSVPAASGRYAWTVPEAEAVRVRVVSGDAVDESEPLEVLPEAPVPLIRSGVSWRYHVESLDGEDWTSPGYRDGDWERGQGPFSICACLPWECACRTYLLDALLAPTVYFRKDFNVEAPFDRLTLDLVHEVGAKIWINGREVYARSIDDESFEALADPEAIAAEIRRVEIDVPEDLLVVGQNTMAVMVKKNAALGPSLYFDVDVTGHRDAEDGCGCTATERGGPGWLALGLLLGLGLRRGRAR